MTTYVASSNAYGAWNVAMDTTRFRAMLTSIKAMLDGCGLVQTSDTNQFDLETVTWPSTSGGTATGCWIYRFSDSQQGTDPIFLRITAGRNSASIAAPFLRVQVGQGSNGSGTLTGTTGTNMLCGGYTYPSTSGTYMYTNYACHNEGFVTFVFGAAPDGLNSPPRFWFTISRSRDQSTGAFDGRGALYYATYGDPLGTPHHFFINWTTGMTANGGFSYNTTCVAGGIAADPDTGDKIAWPHFYWDDGVVKKAWAHWTCHASFLSYGVNTFDASPYGTSRRWLSIGDHNGRAMRGTNASQNWASVLLWEA